MKKLSQAVVMAAIAFGFFVFSADSVNAQDRYRERRREYRREYKEELREARREYREAEKARRRLNRYDNNRRRYGYYNVRPYNRRNGYYNVRPTRRGYYDRYYRRN